MKILVINGSPKGKYSVTLHTVLYLEKLFPECSFEYLNAGQHIKSLEKDMTNALEMIRRTDLILFAYPVYTFITPYQLHRFIELIKESGEDVSGKFAAQISTSKHFYDVTALRFIEENCYDLGLQYIGGLAADMDDLLTERGRLEAEKFWRYVLFCTENGIVEKSPVKETAAVSEYTASLAESPKKDGFDTVIVTNYAHGDHSLDAMIEDFRAAYPYPSRVVNIAEYPFKGGCLGCFHCADTEKCIYTDGFDEFLRNNIQIADAIVYAFTVRGHSMGASFKLYDDRQFCNGHRTVTMGKPMGYIVNGSLASESNLKMIIEGRTEVGHNFLAGIAEDAGGIERLAARLSYALENNLVLPQNFYGVGGMKIFRDLIWLMRGFMRADHRFFKKHGMYDFPQKKRGMAFKMGLVGGLMASPAIKKKMGNTMNEGMVAPYRKVLENMEKEKQFK